MMIRLSPTFFIFATALFSIFLAVASIAEAAAVKRGTIRGQSVKYTTGTVTLDKMGSRYTIKLSGSFKTKAGPGLYLYLGNGSPQKRIGKLRASGAQSVRVPAGVDPAKYSTVYIYCAPFRAIFGSARW